MQWEPKGTSRLGRWTRRLLLFTLILTVAGSTLWFTPTPWYITAPGAAIDTSRLVKAAGGQIQRDRLLMLIVVTQPANLFWYLYAKLDSRAILETKAQFLGSIPDYEQYLVYTRRLMADSRPTAVAVALQQLGYGRGAWPDGVEVTEFHTGSPVVGYLVPGDIIIEAAGLPIRNQQELIALTQTTAAGTPVQLLVRRGDKRFNLVVPTTEHPDADRKGTAAFGLFIKDHLNFDLPIGVEIASGPITGPSAGLMFTLQIVDQLTPGGISGNRVIAGTGTIEWDGRVGAIGGVVQKVHTAESAGAEVIFVPRENYEAAQRVASRILVVPVGHVQEAIAYLRGKAKEPGA